MVATAAALDPRVDEALSGLGGWASTVGPEVFATFAGLHTLQERLDVFKLIHPAAPLVRSRILETDYDPRALPKLAWHCEISITRVGLDLMLGTKPQIVEAK